MMVSVIRDFLESLLRVFPFCFCVVSIVISLISDMWDNGPHDIKFIS